MRFFHKAGKYSLRVKEIQIQSEINNCYPRELKVQKKAYFYSEITPLMRVISVLFLLLYSFSIQAQSAAEAYIARFDSLAIEVSNKYKIPASLLLGLAMHESGVGTSKLCKVNHNHFGMKGRVKSSKTKSGYTYAYRKFDSDEDAYWNFGEVLSKKKYYSKLKGNTDYMKWLKAMKAANYAASSHWISRVDNMIKRYNLTCFDSQFQEQIVAEPPNADSIPVPAK